MVKKIKTLEQLRCLQELFPLHIISSGDLNQTLGWESNTTNLDFIFDESFHKETDNPNYNHISLYVEAEDLIYDLIDNINLLDKDKIVNTYTDDFDIQHDILDGIFQGIRILDTMGLSDQDQNALASCKDKVIDFLRICRDNDKDEDYLFNTLLREISEAEWRTNVYFDKL